MKRFCDKMPCHRCTEMIAEFMFLIIVFALAVVAKFIPLIGY